MTDTEQPAAAPAHEWWRHFVPRRFPRSYVPRRLSDRTDVVNQAACWLLPWDLEHYPGRERGLVEALDGRWTLETLRIYRKGARALSVPLALGLAAAIRVRVEAGAALVAELEAYAAANRDRERRKREAGLMRIDPMTGLSGRQKAGKRRGVKAL
jgi:hypothetical protein